MTSIPKCPNCKGVGCKLCAGGKSYTALFAARDQALMTLKRDGVLRVGENGVTSDILWDLYLKGHVELAGSLDGAPVLAVAKEDFVAECARRST
jgi:hypothetical protein